MFMEHLAQDLTHCKNSVNVGASRVALAVRSLPANAGGMRGMVLIPGPGRSPGGEMATHSSILAWRVPWTEEPGKL